MAAVQWVALVIMDTADRDTCDRNIVNVDDGCIDDDRIGNEEDETLSITSGGAEQSSVATE